MNILIRRHKLEVFHKLISHYRGIGIFPRYYSYMVDFDELHFTRHSLCHISGHDVTEERISQSAPEIMAEIRTIFSDYSYQPISLFVDQIDKIGTIFYEIDPLGVIEKDNPSQFNEYFPEADMLIWLHISKKLTPRSFWAIWEYQFADSNPYKDEHDEKMSSLYSVALSSL